MARNTRRRATQQRNRKVLDILNGVAEDEEDGDGAHATNIERHIDAESVDYEHGDNQRPTRQTRRSARLNKGTAREATPAPISTFSEPPDSPLFVAQDPDYSPNAEAEDAADEEADEANEADEADEDEDERGVEEDGDSVGSEEYNSMSDHEQQLWQEQEQAIATSQREQLELEQTLLSSPSVVINRKKERPMDEVATTTRAAEAETVPANTNHNDLFGGDDEFADSESEQGDENDEESASDNSFDMNNSRHDVGAALQDLFAWDDYRSVESDENDELAEPTEAVQRTRIVDRPETQTPQTSGPSSRKRRRASNDSTDMPDRSRRRREPQNQNNSTARRNMPFALPTDPDVATSPEMPNRIRRRRGSQNRNDIVVTRRTLIALPADLDVATSPDMPNRTRRRGVSPNQNIEHAPSRRPPVARDLPEVADWEATILEERPRDEVIVVGESTTYDDATKVQDLQGTWKRLMKYCQKLKDNEKTREMRRYVTIEAIVDRISDLRKDYKRMQRTRSRGRAIDPDTWKRTRQEVNYISEDADKIRNVLQRRAKEGRASNDLQAQADAVEYAELIWRQIITNLCELALECLKTYYSEEDEWLLSGGFKAVMDILDIAGELNRTITSLHNCHLIFLSPDPGRHIRLELRSISESLADAEVYKHRPGR